jgi:outer membrane protein assembly factor BamB
LPRTRSKLEPLYIGIGGHVVCLHPATGAEVWRTKLKSAAYVTLYQVDGRILAGAGGELFCLEPRTGEILWRNKLKGLGMGVIAFAGSEVASMAAAIAAQSAATTAATM